ncbi:MAG: hypothetical protein QOE13_2342, partial [Gaiellaceae bacterium]|nr:hypothetical protein [Gaiellaceae bacterium]
VDSLHGYRSALLARTGPLCAASWEWKHAYDRFPRLSFAVTRLPLAWPVIQALLRGELADPTASRGLNNVPLFLLGLLGRAAHAPGPTYRSEAATARAARSKADIRAEDRLVAENS